MNKQGNFRIMILVMLASLVVASLWDKIPAIKNSIHYVLNPTAGFLMNWQLEIGMIIIVLIISALTTIIQKYTTDQTELKRIKKEQKAIQKEMKEHRSNPQKMSELNKKNMAIIPQQFKLSMGSIAYTAIPLILLFRWFGDYFAQLAVENGGEPIRFFGFLGWFLFYLIFTLIFSSILKKWWDIA